MPRRPQYVRILPLQGTYAVLTGSGILVRTLNFGGQPSKPLSRVVYPLYNRDRPTKRPGHHCQAAGQRPYSDVRNGNEMRMRMKAKVRNKNASQVNLQAFSFVFQYREWDYLRTPFCMTWMCCGSCGFSSPTRLNMLLIVNLRAKVQLFSDMCKFSEQKSLYSCVFDGLFPLSSGLELTKTPLRMMHVSVSYT